MRRMHRSPETRMEPCIFRHATDPGIVVLCRLPGTNTAYFLDTPPQSLHVQGSKTGSGGLSHVRSKESI